MKMFLSFWLYEILGIVAIFLSIFAYCHLFKKPFFNFVWRHLKSILLVVLLVSLLISILCYYHLFNVTELTSSILTEQNGV